MDRITKTLLGKSGIYCIINTKNQKKYIGSSKNLYRRLSTHRAYLRKGIHQNPKLQNSWNKYGEAQFQYYILEFCDIEALLEREQFYIDTINPYFNIIREVQEVKISEESKLKMSISRKKGFERGTVKLYQMKPIYQYDLEGNYIQEFKSIKEAALQSGVTRSSINRFLEGKYKKGGNFLWSLEKREQLPKYTKLVDSSHFGIPVEITNILTEEVKRFNSLSAFCKEINKNYNAARHAMVHNYPYLRKYKIVQLLPRN